MIAHSRRSAQSTQAARTPDRGATPGASGSNQAAAAALDAGGQELDTPMLSAAGAAIVGEDGAMDFGAGALYDDPIEIGEPGSGFHFDRDPMAAQDSMATELARQAARLPQVATDSALALRQIAMDAKAAMRSGDRAKLGAAQMRLMEFELVAVRDWNDRCRMRQGFREAGLDTATWDEVSRKLDRLWASGFELGFGRAWYPDAYEGPRGVERFRGVSGGLQTPTWTGSLLGTLQAWEAHVEEAVTRWQEVFQAGEEIRLWAVSQDGFFDAHGFDVEPRMPPQLEGRTGRERAYLLAVLQQHVPTGMARAYDPGAENTYAQIGLEDRQADVDYDTLDATVGLIRMHIQDEGDNGDHIMGLLGNAKTGPEKEYVCARMQSLSVADSEHALLWHVQTVLQEDHRQAWDRWRRDALTFSGQGGAISNRDRSFSGAVEATVIENLVSLDQLLSQLASLSEGAALELITRFWGSARHIIEEFIRTQPGHPLFAPIVEHVAGLVADVAVWLYRLIADLTVDDVIGFLKTVGRVIGTILGFAILAAALFMLDSVKQVPIIGGLGEDLVLMLWDAAPDSFKDFLKRVFVDLWPPGVGLALDLQVGATFGIPIHVGEDAYMRVSHKEPGTFELVRGGITTIGADVGVGAGFSGGAGGPGASRGNVGLSAGAQIGTGYKTLVHEIYAFPLSDDRAFLSLIMGIVTGLDAGVDTMVAAFSGQSGQIDPTGYLSSAKMELKAYAEGGAQATASLRPGVDDGSGNHLAGERFGHGQQTMMSNGAFQNPGLMERLTTLKLSLGAALGGEAGFGCEIKDFQRDNGEVTAATVDLYAEASGMASINNGLPLPIPALPPLALELGVGIKASYGVRQGAPGADDAVWSGPAVTVYMKSGDMDRYVGAASETEMSLADFEKLELQSLDAFVESFGEVTYKKRMAIHSVGRGVQAHLDRLPVLRRSGAAAGLRLDGTIDLESKLTKAELKDLVDAVRSVAATRPDGLASLKDDLLQLFVTGTMPAGLMNDVDVIAGSLADAVQALDAHVEVGAGFAGSAQASAGLKVRLDAGASAAITYDLDLLNGGEEALQLAAEEVQAFLTGPPTA